MKTLISLVIAFIIIATLSCNDDHATNTSKDIVMKKITANISTNLNDVDFIDENTGYIVGDSGMVLKTTDAGDNWEKIKTNIDIDFLLKCVKLLNKNDIFIGSVDIILQSNNSGETWSNTKVNGSINDIYFINDKIGYAIGGYYQTNTMSGAIYKTENKGEEWLSPLKKELLGFLSSIILIDSKINIISVASCMSLGLCDVNIFKTIDGGVNYTSTYNLKKFNGILSLSSLDKNTIIGVGSKGTILYSSDKGDTWETKTSGVAENLYSVSGISKDVFYAVGDNGTVISTANKGQNWSKQSSGVDVKLNSICFPSPDYGIVVGDNGTIIKITF